MPTESYSDVIASNEKTTMMSKILSGRTLTVSRQASRHDTKDAVLLHSWFRLESAHRNSTCLRLITSSVVDDMTSSNEEDILMYYCCSSSTDVWVLTHRKEMCRVLLHVTAAWSWRQHHDSDRCAAVFIISFVSTVFLSLRHVADIVSWLLHVLTHAGVRPTILPRVLGWGDYWRGLDWIIGFIDHLYTSHEITRNYSAIANLHNSQFTTAPTKSFKACCVFTSRSLATASTVQILQRLCSRRSWQLHRHLWAHSLEKIWEPRRLTTLWTFRACYRDNFYVTQYHPLLQWSPNSNCTEVFEGFTKWKRRTWNVR
jgi:hypothetical protein